MSLRAKVALGVVAATALLALALAAIGVEGYEQLTAASKRQHSTSKEALEEFNRQAQTEFEEFNREQHRLAIKSIEKLVLAQLDPILATPRPDVSNRLREELNGIGETGIIERIENDNGEIQLSLTPIKPQGSNLDLTAEEENVARRVFETRQHEFLGDVLFVPYNPEPKERKRLQYLLRLKLDIPPVAKPAPLEVPDIPEPQQVDLGPLVIAAFTTLALAMLAVFVLLMFALRRFVLAPLGNVLEDSERIVKGAEGLEVKGFKGGGGKDIETLVAAFNAMFSELKDYQSDLEGKVKDATRTIRKQQQSLVIAQRLASTGTLAAGLAHEVNNPLSGMLNAIRRLKKREELDERSLDYVDLIEEGLGRIEKLMKQILDFSRRRDMKPERFAPESAFKRALQLVRHRIDGKKLRLEEDIRKNLPQLYGNEEEIGQVIMNLLINAADASPDGSAIRVTVMPSESGGVVFMVEDSGDGVPEEIRERIFDPFFTTKEPGKGTGLGLAIAHTIVDNHGGAISIEPGQTLGGAKFVVEFPKAEAHESKRGQEIT